jgi:hypothetical protein
MKDPRDLQSEFDSRRRLMRDIVSMTGWVFLTSAVLERSAPLAIAGDENNGDKAWGSVKGRILFQGEAPAVKEIELEKQNLSADDLKWFKSMGPVVNQEWVVNPKSKAVQFVYVWLLPENPRGDMIIHDSLKVIPADKKLVIVDQEPTGYVPHAVATRAGQGLLMRNQGPVAHVFNISAFKNDSFNKSMPPGSEIVVKDLKAEPAPAQINCPPHPWERMWLRVFEHPYFAVTSADGSFEIKMAPSGPCRLVVWHETLGFKDGRAGKNGSVIKIEGGAITDLGDIGIVPT